MSGLSERQSALKGRLPRTPALVLLTTLIIALDERDARKGKRKTVDRMLAILTAADSEATVVGIRGTRRDPNSELARAVKGARAEIAALAEAICAREAT